jgi:hypothetical protein
MVMYQDCEMYLPKLFNKNSINNQNFNDNRVIIGNLIIYSDNGGTIKSIEFDNNQAISVEQGEVNQDKLVLIGRAFSCFYDCIEKTVPGYYMTLYSITLYNPYIIAGCFGFAGGRCLGKCASNQVYMYRPGITISNLKAVSKFSVAFKILTKSGQLYEYA